MKLPTALEEVGPIAGDSPDNVWVLGDTSTFDDGAAPGRERPSDDRALHWDGSRWTVTKLPPRPRDDDFDPMGIEVAGPRSA